MRAAHPSFTANASKVRKVFEVDLEGVINTVAV